MPTLYRDTGYSLVHLIEDIKHGNIALPDIQRPFVWSSAKIRDLFDSMYRGYPIGTLMFWETGAERGTKQIGGRESDRVAKLLIVDGQQRLTSLFAVITGEPVLTKNFEQKRVRIAFRPNDETFEVTDAAINKDPEFIPDITVLWDGSYKSTVRDFMARLEDARIEGLSHQEQDDLEERIDRVRDLREFRFQVIELGANANEEEVAEIFVRINSEGVKLNQADFILTLMSVHWEKGRIELEGFARSAVDPAVKGPSPKNPFIDPQPDQLLRAAIGVAFRRGRLSTVYNILRGKDLETGEVSDERRVEQFERLATAQEEVLDLTNWFEFLKCLTAAGYRSRRMITSESALIYTYVMWLIGRRDFGIETQTLRPAIARWFFMVHTTGRYTTSTESQIESDLARISGLTAGDQAGFLAELDRIVRSNFTGDYWDITLPNKLDTSSPRSPALYAYWAALNLLDAELLFSEMRIREIFDPAITSPKSIERHHLFPKKYLAQLGVTETRQTNAIGNMSFVDWPENIKIGGEAPISYWHAMTATVDPDRLSRQTYWHALPVGWEQLDYFDFVEKRRVMIAKVVRDGFQTLWSDATPAPITRLLDDLLSSGESQTLEYKSTARWNIAAGMQDKKMEHIIVKAVCGLLNGEGGHLLIGVNDEGEVLGIEADYRTLQQRGNRDGYELFVRQLLDTNLSAPTAGIVKISFESVDGKDVCVVWVAPSGRPVFAKPLGGSSETTDFWVRVGNMTKQLHGDDLIEYRDEHWG